MGDDKDYLILGIGLILILGLAVTSTIIMVAQETNIECDGCTDEYGCEVIVDKEDYKLLICEK